MNGSFPTSLIAILSIYTVGYFYPEALAVLIMFVLIAALAFMGFIYYKFWYIVARKVLEYKD